MRNNVLLSPFQREFLSTGPKIFANSIPKSGTHLLRHILKMMPGIIDRWTYHFDPNVCDYHKQL